MKVDRNRLSPHAIGCAHPRSTAVVLALLCGLSAVRADSDADRARRLVQEGAIMPLEEILPLLRQVRPGTLIELELEYAGKHDAHIYEIKVLDDAGRLWEVELDAATGELIEVELDD